jgi:hypothetical protein
MSDVDLIIQDPDKLAVYLEKYKRFDIVYMQDNMLTDLYNIGFGLIKSSDATISFFEKMRDEIIITGELDQDIVNKYLENSGLNYRHFTIPKVIQSNMTFAGSDFYVMQMLCSNNPTYEENLYEKLVTASILFDLRDLKQFIILSVYNKLIDFAKEYIKSSPLVSEEYISTQ